MAILNNTKKVTVEQLNTVAQAIATKSDARFAKKATTLNGYGITDAYTKTEVDTELGKKANSADLGALASKDEVAKTDLAAALKTEIEGKANTADLGALASKDEVAETDLASALATKINGKADSATTLNGYGITDAYTKTETDAAINSKIAAAYKPGGSIAPAGVTASVLVAANEGKVYDLSADLTLDATTAALFADGTVGEKIVKGTNIVVFNNGTAQAPSYKFDKLAGFVDLSDYAHLADVEVASAQDIQDIVDGIYAD